MIEAEEIAKRIRINDDNGLCCLRSCGGICYEHGELAKIIQDAYEQGVKEAGAEAYRLGWNNACIKMQVYVRDMTS